MNRLIPHRLFIFILSILCSDFICKGSTHDRLLHRLGIPLSLLLGKLELVLLSCKQFNFGFSWGGFGAIPSNKQHLHWVCAGVQSTQFAILIVPFEIFLCRLINYWCHKKLQQIKLKLSLEARTRLDFFSSPTIKITSKQPMTAQLLYCTLLPFFCFQFGI